MGVNDLVIEPEPEPSAQLPDTELDGSSQFGGGGVIREVEEEGGGGEEGEQEKETVHQLEWSCLGRAIIASFDTRIIIRFKIF